MSVLENLNVFDPQKSLRNLSRNSRHDYKKNIQNLSPIKIPNAVGFKS